MARQINNSNEIVWESPAGPELTSGLRLGRVASGAVAGLLLAAAFSLVAGTIDALLLRDVPLRIDWLALGGNLILAGLSGAALGALTAWPETGWMGVLLGAASLVAWSFIQSYLILRAATLIFLPLFLPLMVMSLPLAGFLRWSARRQEQLQTKAGPARWRAQLGLVIVIAIVGGFAGTWSQLPATSQEAVRRVHSLLRKTLAEPASVLLPSAFQATPALRAHAASSYQLEARPASSGYNQTEVTVVFADGYLITCTADAEAAWVLCREGSVGLFEPASPR
jgi:hypothetical protein